jgi:3-oxoadipate enol-lactonase
MPPKLLSFMLYLAWEFLMKVNGVELAANIEGDGVPFIWAHGLTLSMSVEDSTGLFDWSGCAGVCKCIRYDARGHGKSQGSLVTEDYVW